MLRVDNNSFNPVCSPLSIGTGVLLVTAIALATIGLLALFEIPGLSSVSSYWYVFGLGSLVSFVAGLICCCKCLCVSLEKLPASEYNELQQENHEAPGPPSYQTNLSYPANHYIQKPETAEDFFVQARECVQGKEKDKKNYIRARLLYKRAMKLGHIPAIFYLGKCYFLGKGTSQDKDKAIGLFQEAAEKGHMESEYMLFFLGKE